MIQSVKIEDDEREKANMIWKKREELERKIGKEKEKDETVHEEYIERERKKERKEERKKERKK